MTTRRLSAAARLFIAVFALSAFPSSARAGCSSPPGNAGDIVYSSTATIMVYCNGTSWVAMGTSSTTTFGTLTTNNFCTASGSTSIVCTTTSTGSGNVVLSTSPILTGTLVGASSTWSGQVGIGTTTLAGALNIVGTTNIAGTVNGTSFVGSGASLTGIGTSALGGITGTPSGTTYLRGDGTWSTLPASSLTVASTVISSGANTKVLFDNSGILGEYTITGTGNVVMSASPTLTGTIGAASATFSGTVGIGTATALNTLDVWSGGIHIGSSVPAGTTAALYNNGGTLMWNGAAVYTGGVRLTVNSTPIASGANTKVLFDSSGVLSEYTISGTGNVAMTTSPVFTTPNLGTPSAAVLANATGLPIGGLSTTGTANSGTFLRGDGAWTAMTTMTYPGAGIANSTGSAWGTSYSTTGTGNVVLSASPTLTGTISAANSNFSGNVGVGTSTATTALKVNGAESLQFAADYSTATATQNDVAISTASAVRYTGAASVTFTGIAAGSAGQLLFLTNAASSTYTLTLNNQDAGSSAADRIITGTGASVAMANNSSVVLQYDGAASRWRVIGGNGGGVPAGSSTQVQYNSNGAFAGDTKMTWDSVNKMLSVGTGAVTPQYTTGTLASNTVNIIPLAVPITPAGMSGVVTINLASTGQMAIYSASNAISGSPNLYASGSNIAIGTSSATNLLSLNGQNPQIFWMERDYTPNSAGNSLTVQAGGASSAATNKNGGNLVLSSGVSTGTGTSSIQFQTFPGTAASTTDNTVATAMTILGNGNVGIATATPGDQLQLYGSSAYIGFRPNVDSNPTGIEFRNSAGTSMASFDSFANINELQLTLGGDFSIYGNSADILYVKNSSKSVGIGSTAPAAALDVNGTVRATTFAGAVGVSDLNSGTGASSSTFWRGDGTWATVSASGITVASTTIASGTNTKVLYDNSGVVGEYAITGTGNVVMSASPTLTGTITAANANFSGTVTGPTPVGTTNLATKAYVDTAVAGAGGGSGAPVDFQVFTSSGTWTKPGSGTMALIQCWGGGASGPIYSIGGGGGGKAYLWKALSSLTSTVTVTIGPGGAGGGAHNGGNTTFGAYLTATGGGSNGAGGSFSGTGVAGSAGGSGTGYTNSVSMGGNGGGDGGGGTSGNSTTGGVPGGGGGVTTSQSDPGGAGECIVTTY